MGPLTLAFSAASIDMEERLAKREWIKNKEKDRERFLRGGWRWGRQAILSKTSLNRHKKTKQRASRVRRAFEREVRVQSYSRAL